MKMTGQKQRCFGESDGQKEYKETVLLDGIKYGMFYRTKNVENPVILFIHGGPGSPEYIFFQSHIKSNYLEEYYTVCYMEQRGAGMLYDGEKDISGEMLIQDIGTFTKYLCEKFRKEKVILMGHSWGTYLGIKAASQYSALFHCYIGISQMVHVRKSEIKAYHYFRENLTEKNRKKYQEK